MVLWIQVTIKRAIALACGFAALGLSLAFRLLELPAAPGDAEGLVDIDYQKLESVFHHGYGKHRCLPSVTVPPTSSAHFSPDSIRTGDPGQDTFCLIAKVIWVSETELVFPVGGQDSDRDMASPMRGLRRSLFKYSILTSIVSV